MGVSEDRFEDEVRIEDVTLLLEDVFESVCFPVFLFCALHFVPLTIEGIECFVHTLFIVIVVHVRS